MVVHKSMSFFLKSIIIPNQLGFVARRSTTTNLGSSMSFASPAVYCHIYRAKKSTFHALGVACGVSKQLHNARMFSILYTSVCRSLFQYALPVGNKICLTDSLRIERPLNGFCPSSSRGPLHVFLRVAMTAVVL